ncbi:MAG: hydrogenase formation protein HypD [Saezia sp.]
MQFVDEYRNPELVQSVLKRINQRIADTPFTAKKPMHIMEVCGGHTHAIFKFGLDQLLPPQIEFIHGPGCPVCVLPMGRIDTCIELAEQPNVIFCTFGDAMRVPGQQGSLLQARERGCDVRMVYSPLDALQLAIQNPDKKVVFFGLGFETTMPSTALTLKQAKAQNVENFFFLCQHITILPTLRALLGEDDVCIDAFIAPGHVSMVIGKDAYNFICDEFKKPLVIAGFEPLDILQSILMLIEQFAANECKVENQYSRVVPNEGNRRAQEAILEVFETKGNKEWRGLGVIADSGVVLTPAYARFDAETHFNCTPQQVADDPDARCGDVLTGRCQPNECTLFGTRCTPDNAFGALMVSSEGACAAFYQFRR